MAIHLSPGVIVQEIDLSSIIPQVSVSIGAIVGTANKGPVVGDEDSPTLITNPSQFIEVFGEPDGSNMMHYAALQFLESSNQLWVSRIKTTNTLYACMKIGSFDSWDSTEVDATAQICVSGVSERDGAVGGDTEGSFIFKLAAKNIGTQGNNIEIAIVNYRDFAKHGTEIIRGDSQGFFYTDPPTNLDEFIIAVYDADLNQYVESWTVSRDENRKNAQRQSMYIETVINNNSNYIYAVDHSRDTDATSQLFDSTSQPLSTLGLVGYSTKLFKYDQSRPSTADATNITRLVMAGAAVGDTATEAEVLSAWDVFKNPDNIDVNILIQAGSGTGAAVGNKLIEVTQARKDCIAVLDVPYTKNSPMEAINWKRKEWNPNTSYAALYWSWVKIYDRYTDAEIWVPPSVFVPQVYALTDYTREPWFAPAGLNRGTINIIDVQYKPSQGERDILYMNNINPIAVFPGEGTAIWGQKTLQTKASATDRVNVRRLLLILEKAIAKASRFVLFEPNDRFTRKQLVQMIDPFLRDVQGRRGIEYFKVVCDTSNNTSQVIDRNELVCDIYIQPTKAAEFITLKFNILRTGVIAEELV